MWEYTVKEVSQLPYTHHDLGLDSLQEATEK